MSVNNIGFSHLFKIDGITNIGTVPIVIPTYNNRKPNILKFVSDGEIFQKRECHIYIQEDQKQLYSEYKNVIVHIVPDEYAGSIRKKRFYILNDFKEDLFWFLDDDTNGWVNYFDGEDHILKIDDAMEIIEKQFDVSKDGAANINILHLKWYWRQYQKKATTVNSSPSNVVLLNAKVCRDNNIHYPQDDFINEDTVLAIKLARLGYRCWTFLHMFCKQMVPYGGSATLATHDRFKSAMIDYISEGDAFFLHTKNNNKQIVGSPLIKKIVGVKERRYNSKLLELCKEGNEQKIIDYLKDFKYNSRNCEIDLIIKDE